jgi:hypothetical protein
VRAENEEEANELLSSIILNWMILMELLLEMLLKHT